jgi:hypothetical protein
VARFTSSILPARPIAQRQALATAAVQSASAAAVIDERVLEVAADPGSALGDVLNRYEQRLYALENPIP